jgi:hypothetical protein
MDTPQRLIDRPESKRLLIAFRTEVIEAVNRAAQQALRDNKRAGNAIPTWSDGRHTLIEAVDIVLDEETTDRLNGSA